MRYFRYRHYERLRYSTKFRKWLVAQATRLGMTPKAVFDTLLVQGKMSMDQVTKYKPIIETRLIAMMGDSRSAFSFNQPGGRNVYYRNVGLAHWIKRLGGGKLQVPISLIGGVQSYTSEQVLGLVPDHITAMKSKGSTRVVLWVSTNDRGAGWTLLRTQTAVLAIIKAYNDASISVDLISETPRGNGSSSYELTADQKVIHKQVHDWMESLRGTNPKLSVYDFWTPWLDTTSGTNYYVKAGQTVDQIHPDKGGSYAGAAVLVPGLLTETGMTATLFPTDNTLYNAVSAALGSLIPNPMMTGTGGTINSGATGASGALAANWALDGASVGGLTCVLSKETIGGIEYQKAVVTGTPTSTTDNPTYTFTATVDLTKVAVGDTLKAVGRSITAGTGISNAGAQFLLIPVYQVKYDAEDSNSASAWPSANLGVMGFETPVYVHESAITQINLGLQCTLLKGAAVNATFWWATTKVMKTSASDG